jgi:hypothetical protein
MADGHPRNLPDVTLRGRRGKLPIGPVRFEVTVSAAIAAKILQAEQAQGVYRTTLTRRALEAYFGDRHPPLQ